MSVVSMIVNKYDFNTSICFLEQKIEITFQELNLTEDCGDFISLYDASSRNCGAKCEVKWCGKQENGTNSFVTSGNIAILTFKSDSRNSTGRGFTLSYRANGTGRHSSGHYSDVIRGPAAPQITRRLFGRRSKKTPKLRVTGLCVGNSPMDGEFPAQMASNAENVAIWWRHHGIDMSVIRTFRITCLLCKKSPVTGVFPAPRASDAEHWWLLCCQPEKLWNKQSRGRWNETP